MNKRAGRRTNWVTTYDNKNVGEEQEIHGVELEHPLHLSVEESLAVVGGDLCCEHEDVVNLVVRLVVGHVVDLLVGHDDVVNLVVGLVAGLVEGLLVVGGCLHSRMEDPVGGRFVGVW